MSKIVFMIDGWFMWKRVQALNAFRYEGSEIRKYCLKHIRSCDSLYRIFYYDTRPLKKKGHHPLTNNLIDFSVTPIAKAQEKLLKSIKKTPNFALRLGRVKWRKKWILDYDKIKELLGGTIAVADLTESDFKPDIEQKAVDMKIGIDITHIATNKLADILIIITGDSDIVPALKLARREGMQVGIDPLKNPISPELAEHVDFLTTKV
jgi:uncharacterized LabA/DUF88 family protein